MRIITNNVPRDLVDAYELTADERTEFDYLDWPAIDEGCDSASFFRYKGEMHDLGEFMATSATVQREPSTNHGPTLHDMGWHGYRSDTFFSALVVRYVDDESIVVGLALADD